MVFRIHEDHPIMSFTVSKDGRLALLNIATQVGKKKTEENFDNKFKMFLNRVFIYGIYMINN